MPGRVLLIAGEASGDLHGAGVVGALQRMQPEVDLYGVGGDQMRNAGMDVLFHIERLAFMGFVEVLKNLHTVRELRATLTAAVRTRRPDVAVLIDYPGFNLRFAKTLSALGVPVIYYISPQVWAWHRSRVNAMRGVVTAMKVVFPFEVEIYRAAGIPVEFVGHPIVERIACRTSKQEFLAAHGLDPTKRLVALLPGSRVQEIERIFPVMIEAGRRLIRDHDVHVAVGVAPNLGLGVLGTYLAKEKAIVPIEHATYDLMNHADAAIVTSGTATLETGWFGTPMVIVYRTSPLTFQIGKMLVDVPNIGLANIVAGKTIVPELIQGDLTAERLFQEVSRLVVDGEAATAMRRDLGILRERLGGPGASEKVARAVLAHVPVS